MPTDQPAPGIGYARAADAERLTPTFGDLTEEQKQEVLKILFLQTAAEKSSAS